MVLSSRTRLVVLALALTAGCTDLENQGTGPDASSGGSPPTMFVMFEGLTASMTVNGGGHQLSITDAVGTNACAAVEDFNLTPAGALHQLLINVTADDGTVCPVGNYDVSRSCPSTYQGTPALSGNCAYYRAWDASGALLGTTAAINGTISVTGSAGSCTVRPIVGFVGGSYSASWTFTGGVAGGTYCQVP